MLLISHPVSVVDYFGAVSAVATVIVLEQKVEQLLKFCEICFCLLAAIAMVEVANDHEGNHFVRNKSQQKLKKVLV